jgi:ELWxxDGT repeat protein
MTSLRSLPVVLGSLALLAAPAPAQVGPTFFPVAGPSNPQGLFDHGGRLLFAALTTSAGNEPWASTYPSGPTFGLGDLNPGTGHGVHTGDPEFVAPASLNAIEFGERVLFSTHAGVGGQGEGNIVNLWISDGTVQGTELLWTFDKPGGTFNYGYTIDGVNLGNAVVFNAYTDADGWALWRTDGTVQNTGIVRRLGNLPFGITRLGNRAVFYAPNLNFQFHLWITNGTPAGTSALKQMSVAVAFPSRLERVGEEVYFSGQDAAGAGLELWKTDGTPQGTVQVIDLEPGSEGSEPENLTRVGDLLYFTAKTSLRGRELWRTDGTAAGTQLCTDINPGPSDTTFEELTAIGDRLFFHGPVSGKGRVYVYELGVGLTELGAFDGVSTGVNPSDFIHDMEAIGSRRVMFGGRQGNLGDELWVSDGTVAGTQLYADLDPGSGYGQPQEITLANGQVFLRRGFALFSSSPLMAANPGATADAIGQPCAASGFLPRLRATDPVLGATLDVELRDAQPALPALVFLAPPVLPTALGSGCTTYLDISQLELLFIGALDGSGAIQWTSANLPTDPGLAGQQLALQAAIGPTATAPLGFDLSNGLLMTLGQ